MRRIFHHRLLRQDIVRALAYTQKGWGDRKKQEYKDLIREAKTALRENPRIGPVRPDIHEEARVYRLAKPGRDAAHVFVYVITPDDSIILVRLLNETMDLPRHFPTDYSDL